MTARLLLLLRRRRRGGGGLWTLLVRVDGVRCWCENGGCLGSFSFMVAAWCGGGCVHDVAADVRTVIAMMVALRRRWKGMVVAA
ncbi:hypothetical protein DEO72_LG11g1569 [Vigna unguiculata]|uniref:Uncharacterized protein n=1 Tax=Vigna unguiculata TaxID=3917 RepID=A0A4D6NLP8_VIGUN|nr:hypothetical protein DEO72_LG11g1569 [Vigna unguiculata]